MDRSFLAITCLNMRPYLNYPEYTDVPKDTVIPTVLLIYRWDGTVGFPGGFVDTGKNETPIEAAIRECLEEIGYLANRDHINLIHEEESNGCWSRLFHVDVTQQNFSMIVTSALGSGCHLFSEVRGILFPLLDLKGIIGIQRAGFAGNGLQQFQELLKVLKVG